MARRTAADAAAPEIEDPETASAEESAAHPEPKPAAGVVIQDNVSTPGVQRTILPDGSVQEFGEARDSDAADDVVPDPDGSGPTTPDDEDVPVALSGGGGWVNVPHPVATIADVKPADAAATYSVTFEADATDAAQTCITVADAPADLAEAALVVTFNEVPAS